MLTVNANYVSKKNKMEIALSRTMNDGDDFRMILGEVLYSIEVQSKDFKTHTVFEKYSEDIPEKFTKNHKLFDEHIGDAVLSVSVSEKQAAKKPVKKAAVAAK